jgi:hypothetical protein
MPLTLSDICSVHKKEKKSPCRASSSGISCPSLSLSLSNRDGTVMGAYSTPAESLQDRQQIGFRNAACKVEKKGRMTSTVFLLVCTPGSYIIQKREYRRLNWFLWEGHLARCPQKHGFEMKSTKDYLV